MLIDIGDPAQLASNKVSVDIAAIHSINGPCIHAISYIASSMALLFLGRSFKYAVDSNNHLKLFQTTIYNL